MRIEQPIPLCAQRAAGLRHRSYNQWYRYWMDLCVVCGGGGVGLANGVVIDEDWSEVSEAKGATNPEFMSI